MRETNWVETHESAGDAFIAYLLALDTVVNTHRPKQQHQSETLSRWKPIVLPFSGPGLWALVLVVLLVGFMLFFPVLCKHKGFSTIDECVW
jgi:hypothetical protein